MASLLVKSSKNKNSEELKKISWEIVKEIKTAQEEYVKTIEEKKAELEKEMQEMKNIITKINNQEIEIKKTSSPKVPKRSIDEERTDKIKTLYREGFSVEDIAKKLNEYRGVIETVINMEKI